MVVISNSRGDLLGGGICAGQQIAGLGQPALCQIVRGAFPRGVFEQGPQVIGGQLGKRGNVLCTQQGIGVVRLNKGSDAVDQVLLLGLGFPVSLLRIIPDSAR